MDNPSFYISNLVFGLVDAAGPLIGLEQQGYYFFHFYFFYSPLKDMFIEF